MKTVKNLQFAIIIFASMMSFKSVASVVPTNIQDVCSLEAQDDDCYGQVKIVNRTYYPVAVHINGYFVGNVGGGSYQFFNAPAGSNYVTTTWSTGFYNYWTVGVPCQDFVTLVSSN